MGVQARSSVETPRRVRSDAATIRIAAPARLHLGFLDPAGTLGRRYGSLGLVVEGRDTVIELAAATSDRIVSREAPELIERARAFVETLRERTVRAEPLCLQLEQSPPAHAGFGSGTQLALAIGRAFARWQGLEVSSAQLARWLGRGARSGVGIAAFDAGGLLVDGGPGEDGAPAPLLARVSFPEAWRVVLVQDSRQSGLAGMAEKRALAELPALPRETAADICHEVLMRIMPGAASAEFATFAAGLTHMQQLLGAHFAPAQAGSAWTSAAVGRVLESIGAAHGAAIGQSSWGPTGFAILPSQLEAQAALDALRGADPALSISIVRGRNRGALITEAH